MSKPLTLLEAQEKFRKAMLARDANTLRELTAYKPVPEGDQFVGEIGMSLGEQLLNKPGEINPEDLEDEEVKPNGKAKHYV